MTISTFVGLSITVYRHVELKKKKIILFLILRALYFDPVLSVTPPSSSQIF